MSATIFIGVDETPIELLWAILDVVKVRHRTATVDTSDGIINITLHHHADTATTAAAATAPAQGGPVDPAEVGPTVADEPDTAAPPAPLVFTDTIPGNPANIPGAVQRGAAWVRWDGKDWQCTCGDTTRTIGYMRAHRSNVTAGTHALIPAPLPVRTAPAAAPTDEPRQAVTVDPERTYRCAEPGCGRSFTTKQGLGGHTSAFHGGKVACRNGCGRYLTVRNIAAHERRCTGPAATPPDEPTDGAQTAPARIEATVTPIKATPPVAADDDHPWECSCGWTFADRAGMAEHRRLAIKQADHRIVRQPAVAPVDPGIHPPHRSTIELDRARTAAWAE